MNKQVMAPRQHAVSNKLNDTAYPFGLDPSTILLID